MERQAEYERIKVMIAELEASGVTIYKLALMLGQQYNTVKHWKQTGRVESHDAKILGSIHWRFCSGQLHGCQIQPQYCKVLTISTG